MSEVLSRNYDYRYALQELICDLLQTGWGEVVLGLTPTGDFEDPAFAAGLQRLIEEFQIKPTIEIHGNMAGFFFGYMPPFTD